MENSRAPRKGCCGPNKRKYPDKGNKRSAPHTATHAGRKFWLVTSLTQYLAKHLNWTEVYQLSPASQSFVGRCPIETYCHAPNLETQGGRDQKSTWVSMAPQKGLVSCKKTQHFITMYRDILNESITVESNQASVFAALTIYFRLNDNCNKNAFQ